MSWALSQPCVALVYGMSDTSWLFAKYRRLAAAAISGNAREVKSR